MTCDELLIQQPSRNVHIANAVTGAFREIDSEGSIVSDVRRTQDGIHRQRAVWRISLGAAAGGLLLAGLYVWKRRSHRRPRAA